MPRAIGFSLKPHPVTVLSQGISSHKYMICGLCVRICTVSALVSFEESGALLRDLQNKRWMTIQRQNLRKKSNLTNLLAALTI